MEKDKIQLFEDQPIRTAWVEDEEDGGGGRSESESGRQDDGEGDGPAGGIVGSREGRDGKAAW